MLLLDSAASVHSLPVLIGMLWQNFDTAEVCAKSLRQLELSRTDDDRFGFTTEAELGEGREDELRVFVADVELGGAAHRSGAVHTPLSI